LKLSLTTGLLDPKRLDSWIPEKRRAIRKAVEAGMKAVGQEIVLIAQDRMRSAFKVRKAGFVKSLRMRLYAGIPEKFPALMIGSKVPWLGIHTRGGHNWRKSADSAPARTSAHRSQGIPPGY